MDEIEREKIRLRDAQAKAVMPLIGGLLDGWDMVPNDLKGWMENDAELLCRALSEIQDAMEYAEPDPDDYESVAPTGDSEQ